MYVVVCALVCALAGCSSKQGLPNDPNLEKFIDVSARCSYVERAFAGDPDLFKEEMAKIDFPPNWKELVDSLIARYGTDAAFWDKVYTEIVERSRNYQAPSLKKKS
jgi:hypothetical protein